MADRRIYELATKSAALGANDYFAVDNGTEAESKKLPTSYFTDQLADMQNVYGAKNQLPYPYTHTTKTENGLTFTDLGNGKVTVSGTATAETTFYLDHANAFADKDAGTYILSGCPEGGNRSSGYFLEISGRATASDNWTTIATDIGEGATFTITTEMLSWVSIHVFIRVRSGKAISTPITYAPMIRLASIQDDTWVPYAKTNKELTDAFKNQVANKDDEYSPSKPYEVGDRCIYNNVLYKCITACSAAAWSVNQTNFEATTLAESVTELNSALTDVDNDLTTLSNNATRVIAKTVSFNANIASYVNSYSVGKLLHINGLFVVNTALPINTKFMYFDGTAARIQKSAIIGLGVANTEMLIGAGNTYATNDQGVLAVGTYCIDTWFLIQ